MRKYYIHYYRDFANTYNLYYADEGMAVPDAWERITRKEAEALARKERRARRENPSFSSFATAAIYPADYPDDGDIINDKRYALLGCIWEKQEIYYPGGKAFYYALQTAEEGISLSAYKAWAKEEGIPTIPDEKYEDLLEDYDYHLDDEEDEEEN